MLLLMEVVQLSDWTTLTRYCVRITYKGRIFRLASCLDIQSLVVVKVSRNAKQLSLKLLPRELGNEFSAKILALPPPPTSTVHSNSKSIMTGRINDRL